MTSYRLLLIEDDHVLACLLTRCLIKDGYQVAHAENGLIGLERLALETFDLVLLDYVMPHLDGHEVLRRLANLPSAPPVIMLSSSSDLETAVEAMKLGATDYVLKEPGERHPLLLRAIEQTLERICLRVALRESERKRRESEEMFRTITENADDLTLILDAEHRFCYVSPSFEQLTGFARAQTVGTTPRRFLHPDDLSGLRRAARTAWAEPGRAIETADFRGYDRHGQEHHFTATLNAMPDKPGVRGLVVHCRDITQRIASEQQIKTAKAQAERYLDCAGALILAIGPDGRVELINEFGCRLLDASEQEVLGRHWLRDFVPNEHASHQRALFNRFFTGELTEVDQFEGTVNTLSGLKRTLTWSIQPIHDARGVAQLLLSGLDITQRKQAEAALAKSQERYGLATQAAKVGVWDWDLRSAQMYIDPNLKSALGYEAEELADRPEAWRARIHPDERDKVNQAISACIEGRSRKCEVEHRMVCKDGSERWFLTRAQPGHDEENRVVRLIGTDTDITDLKYAEMHIEHLATHDFLTGLPNRVLMLDRFAIALAHARRTSSQVALLFVDLDGFKPVNDTYGHDAGDEVLRQIALRMQRGFRATDTVARFGGDEFVVILTQVHQTDDVRPIAEKLLEHIEEPIDLDDQQSVCLSASIGVALYPRDGETSELMIKAADSAMYAAKRAGKQGYAFASKENYATTRSNQRRYRAT